MLAPFALVVALLVFGRYPGKGALARTLQRERRCPRAPRRVRARRPRPLERRAALRFWAGDWRAARHRTAAVAHIPAHHVQGAPHSMYRRTLPASAVAAAALAVPAGAQAHVTLQPNTAQAGAFTVENVRVPNERDNASTVKVDLRLPNGFAEALYQPAPGWKVKVYKTKLAKPIQTDDGPVTEQVSRIVWTGDGKQGKIAPSQFRDFPLSVQIPGKAGSKLTFKALQTYSNGEVVRWIGPESADTPAPTVMVSSGASEDGHAHSGATGSSGGSPTAKPAASSSSSSDTSASKGLGITALVVGASASWLVSPPSRSAGAGRPPPDPVVGGARPDRRAPPTRPTAQRPVTPCRC